MCDGLVAGQFAALLYEAIIIGFGLEAWYG